MRINLCFIIMLIGIMLMDVNFLDARSKLFVVTRSTKKFRIGSYENPTVGLFSTSDYGKTWRHYGWPYTKCFSVSAVEQDADTVFYLSCGNGVLKSDDSGKSWRITSGWQMTECLKTAIDPKDPHIVYAATAYGIFKTTDSGESWREKNVGLTSTFTPAVIIDRTDRQRLWVATESGIHQSFNGAESWQPVALLGLGIRTIVQHPEKPHLLAVGTEDDGVFISSDHGKSWQRHNRGLTHLTVYALAFASQNPELIYVGTFQGGVFKSIDGGKSWVAVNQNLRVLDIHALLVDPQNESRVFAGTMNDGVWMSQDSGANWKFIGLETSQVWDMIMLTQ
ncbi:MAG TPA: hypothetical protein ENN22_06145 [bacterium]|nr:hypothetical protein [bacterium]